MKALFALVAIAAGTGSALQSGSNAALQKALASPLWTVVAVTVVTVTTALLVAVVAGAPLPPMARVGAAPWWAWIGGILGVGFVLATVYATPQLGAGLFIGLIVTASTLASLVLDHYGLMGFDVHKAGVGRIVGGLLMAIGVALIAAF